MKPNRVICRRAPNDCERCHRISCLNISFCYDEKNRQLDVALSAELLDGQGSELTQQFISDQRQTLIPANPIAA